MPDIPLDTLFIVGLLLASFIGKLMEGKARNKKSKRDQGQQQQEPKDTQGLLVVAQDAGKSFVRHGVLFGFKCFRWHTASPLPRKVRHGRAGHSIAPRA